jgi:hypothetical protein
MDRFQDGNGRLTRERPTAQPAGQRAVRQRGGAVQRAAIHRRRRELGARADVEGRVVPAVSREKRIVNDAPCPPLTGHGASIMLQ